MSRKLTPKERMERDISHIMERIKNIEKDYDVKLVRFACQRYSNKKCEEARLLKEISEKEKQLTELRRKKNAR
jgi:hypothetical protein